MSFDFGVWYPQNRIPNKEAEELYIRLCEGTRADVVAHPAVEKFYAELTARHPEIDTIPENKIGDYDYCPWSCALDHSPGHVNFILRLVESHLCTSIGSGASQQTRPCGLRPAVGRSDLPGQLRRYKEEAHFLVAPGCIRADLCRDIRVLSTYRTFGDPALWLCRTMCEHGGGLL